jgi:hypothetical protein
MKIDDKARKYFSDYDTLEQLDTLDATFRAYLRDLADRVFVQLDQGINVLSQKHGGWVAKQEKSGQLRGALLENRRIKGLSPLEVGFWCDESETWSCFNASWVGVRRSGKQRRKEVFSILSSCFRNPEQESKWPIFENFKSWPNLKDDPYVSLHRITADNGKKVVREILDQVADIVTTIEMSKSSSKRA